MRGRNPDKAIRFFALTRKRRSVRNLAVSNERTEFDEVTHTVYSRLRVLVVSFSHGHAKASYRGRTTRHAFLFARSSLKSAAPTRATVGRGLRPRRNSEKARVVHALLPRLIREWRRRICVRYVEFRSLGVYQGVSRYIANPHPFERVKIWYNIPISRGALRGTGS